MKPIKKRPAVDSFEIRIAQLETLVDELIKESPQEARIRSYMKAAGLPYSSDPIVRMNCVLEALDGARELGPNRGGEHGQNL